MKKIFTVFLSLMLALSLCSCGGGSTDQNTAEKTAIGTWSSTIFADNGELSNADYGLSTLTFNQDGSGVLTLLGDTYEFTWEFSKKDNSTFEAFIYKMNMDGETTTFCYFLNEADQVNGSLLLLLDDDVGMYYEKD